MSILRGPLWVEMMDEELVHPERIAWPARRDGFGVLLIDGVSRVTIAKMRAQGRSGEMTAKVARKIFAGKARLVDPLLLGIE